MALIDKKKRVRDSLKTSQLKPDVNSRKHFTIDRES